MDNRISQRQRRSAQFVPGTSFDEPSDQPPTSPHEKRQSRKSMITPVHIAPGNIAEEREAYIRRLSTTSAVPVASERKRSVLLSKYLRQGSKPIIWTTTEDSMLKALEIPLSYEKNLRTQTVDEEESDESTSAPPSVNEVQVPMTVVRDALCTLARHDDRFKDPSKLQRVLSSKAIARNKAAMKASIARLRKGKQMSSPAARPLPPVSPPIHAPLSPNRLSFDTSSSESHAPLVVQLSPTKNFTSVLNTSPCFATMTCATRREVENTLQKTAITLEATPHVAAEAGTKLVYLPQEATCKRWLIDRIEPSIEQAPSKIVRKNKSTQPESAPIPAGKPKVFRPHSGKYGTS